MVLLQSKKNNKVFYIMSSELTTIKKNVLITAALNASSFTKNINIDFEPDEMTVRWIHFSTVDGTTIDAEAIIGVLSSSLVNDRIGTFCAALVSNRVNLTFQMNRKPVRGEYTFNITDVSGVPATRTGHIAIALEFVQYVNKKYAT